MKRASQTDDHQLEPISGNQHASASLMNLHRENIVHQLQHLGAVQYDLSVPETDVLPLVIHMGEKIQGVVYGKYKEDTTQDSAKGRGVLIATDRRVLLVDHKVIFTKCDEFSYRVVSGVSFSRLGFGATLILHTRLGNISIRTFNMTLAHSFVEAIEENILREEQDDD